MSTVYDLNVIILGTASILYAFMVVVAFRGRKLQERTARWLILYAAVSFFWTLGQVVQGLNWPALAAYGLLARMPFYGVTLLAWLFLHLTRAFLRHRRRAWDWWALGAVWAVVLVILDANLLYLPETLWGWNDWSIERQRLIFSVLAAGWVVFMGAAALLILKTYRHTQQPLHRNRLKYWSLTWGLTVVGDVLFFAGYWTPGGILCAVAVVLATYAIVTHRLADVRQIIRRGLSYLLITLLIMSLYIAGFAAMQYVFQAAPSYSPMLAGAVMALVLAVLFQPLLVLIQRVVNRLTSTTGYNPSHILREYSTSISNILDLELLANVMVNLISEKMKVRHSQLFVVDREKGFHLREVGSTEEEEKSPGILTSESPIAAYLRQEQTPLTQYDIDLLARFQAISPEERDWLSSLDADVYVPIHAKGEWIGLLALGPKSSGDRYYDEDLALLGTLADQTAVALENARLVEDLVRAHNDLGQAYAALAEANRQLQELDKLKSAFIGVITHELRTPFANIAFSMELLERHGQEHLPPELNEQVEELATGIKTAQTMVDNLVTFATFLSKQGELHPTRLDVCQVVQDSLLPLTSLAESKGITLHIEVPEEALELRGDKNRLGDAVYHLVHNAIKFTEAGGEVWIRCQNTDRRIRLEVQDTGVGVSNDKLPTLWEDFTQMADPLRRGVEGLGLGLALVKYVVNAHGGDVFAHGEEGVGSTFGFEIPLRG
jgi:signal transduction histidine kinase